MSRKFPIIGKSTSERLLEYNKAQSPIVVRRKPSQSDGAEGDIVLANELEGVKMYAKIGNTWRSFSSDAIRANRKELHIIHGGWGDSTSSSDLWLPFRTPDADKEDVNTALSGGGGENTDYAYLFPYTGRVKSLWLRSSGATGNVYVEIYKAGNTVAEADDADAVLIHTSSTRAFGTSDSADDDIAHQFTFNGTEVTAGEIISIKCFASNYWGDLMYSLVLEYDIIDE